MDGNNKRIDDFINIGLLKKVIFVVKVDINPLFKSIYE